MIVLEIDPNVVRPGWTPLIVTIVLAAALVVLYRSMRRQFTRIRHLPTEAEVAAARAAERRQNAEESPSEPSEAAAGREDSSPAPHG